MSALTDWIGSLFTRPSGAGAVNTPQPVFGQVNGSISPPAIDGQTPQTSSAAPRAGYGPTQIVPLGTQTRQAEQSVPSQWQPPSSVIASSFNPHTTNANAVLVSSPFNDGAEAHPPVGTTFEGLGWTIANPTFKVPGGSA